MAEDLAEIGQIAGALLRSLSSAERRKLLRTMARDLQGSQRQRITRQQDPDGKPFTPRKTGKLRRKGAIRRAAMFRKLKMSRNLAAGATDTEAWVGFSGRAARIARVHQEGLEDKPTKNAKPVRYARRTLLGDTEAERGRMLDLLLEHVDRRP